MASIQKCKCVSRNKVPPNLYWGSSSQNDSTLNESFESDCSSSPPQLIPYHQVNDDLYVTDTSSESSVSAQSSPAIATHTAFKFLDDDKKNKLQFSRAETDVIDGELIHSFATLADLQKLVSGQPRTRSSPIEGMDSSSYDADDFPFTGAWNLRQRETCNTSSVKRKLDPTAKPNVARVTRRKVSADAFDDSGFSEEKENISRRTSSHFVSSAKKSVIPVITISDSEEEDETAHELVHLATKVTKVAFAAVSRESAYSVSVPTDEIARGITNIDTKVQEETFEELVPYLAARVNLPTSEVPDIIDAAVLLRPEEAYCEDYDVPCQLPFMAADCSNRFCRLGCICDSLSYLRSKPEHCTYSEECMWNCRCENLGYKSKLRSRSIAGGESQALIRKSPTKNDEPRPSTSQNRNSELAIANSSPLALNQAPNNSRLAIESKPGSLKATGKLDPANSQLVLYKPCDSNRSAMPTPLAIVKECSSLKSEVSTHKEAIRDLGSQLQNKEHEVEMLKQQLQLQNKQQEVEMLKHQLQLNTVSAGMLEVFPKLIESAKLQIERLTALTDAAAKKEVQLPPADTSSTSTKSETAPNVTKDEPVVDRQEPAAVQPLPVEKIETVPVPAPKNEAVTIPAFAVKKDEAADAANRVSVEGVYTDCVPWKADVLDQIAKENDASGFIRQMMRRMFTFDYLTSKTYSKMEKQHQKIIYDATKNRFSKRRDRQGNTFFVTDEFIKSIIQSEFGSQKKDKRLKGR